MVRLVVRRAATVLALCALAWSCRAGTPPPAELGVVERVVGTGAGVATALPVLIAVHGLGDTPESFCTFVTAGLERAARVVCPRAPTPWRRGYSWFPPLEELSGASDLAAAIERAGESIAALARTIGSRPNTVGRPVLVGYSQGGMAAYYLAARHASLFSASVPIAGMLPSALRGVPQGGPIALTALHGMDDELVPYAQARATVEAFRAAWPGARLRGYSGVGHRLSAEMRADLFEQLNALLVDALGPRAWSEQ